MPEFFLQDPQGTKIEFDKTTDVNRFIAEASVTHTWYGGDAEHPGCMQVTSTVDGNGVYYADTGAVASKKYITAWDYRADSSQEIDWLIHDQTNAASIDSGTLYAWGNTWQGFEVDFTVPATCTSVRIYFRAGTSSGSAFYIDNFVFQGNLIEFDPEAKDYRRTYDLSRHEHYMQDGGIVVDSSGVRMNCSLSFAKLTKDQTGNIMRLIRSNRSTYFDDGHMPQMVDEATLYTETPYTFSGITNPSGTHTGKYLAQTALPSAKTDFDSGVEFSTANYTALGADDNSYVETVISAAEDINKYAYHQFMIDISGEYSSIDQIRGLKVRYKGSCSDAGNNLKGITLYLWDEEASIWMEQIHSSTSDKQMLSYSTTTAAQAQAYVDITNQRIRVLVRSRGLKGSGGNITLRSYYLEVVVNEGLSDEVALSGRAKLSSGDVVSVQNINTGTSLTLGYGGADNYQIGDGLNRIIGIGSTHIGSTIRVTYNCRQEMAVAPGTAEAWFAHATNADPNKSVALGLVGLNRLTDLGDIVYPIAFYGVD